MGWFFSRRVKRALKIQHDELLRFVSHIRAMDGAELGGLVVMATDVRRAMEAEGHDLMDPIVYFAKNPLFPIALSNSTHNCNKKAKRLPPRR